MANCGSIADSESWLASESWREPFETLPTCFRERSIHRHPTYYEMDSIQSLIDSVLLRHTLNTTTTTITNQ
jgi:hypothetical protein